MSNEEFEGIKFEQRQRRILYVVLTSFLIAMTVALSLR
jgi:hypothetical protein